MLTLEVVPLPVTDVDRARAFYSEQVGFILGVDYRLTPDFRVVQLTPAGSACSVHLVVADSGSRLHNLCLVTSDLAAEMGMAIPDLALFNIFHLLPVSAIGAGDDKRPSPAVTTVTATAATVTAATAAAATVTAATAAAVTAAGVIAASAARMMAVGGGGAAGQAARRAPASGESQDAYRSDEQVFQPMCRRFVVDCPAGSLANRGHGDTRHGTLLSDSCRAGLPPDR